MAGAPTARGNDVAPDGDPHRMRRLLAGGALGLAALLAGITFGDARAEAAFPGINGKLFCEEASPVFPGTLPGNVYSINPDGTGRTMVTSGTLVDPADPASGLISNRDASVSPDGKRMVFGSNRSGLLSLYVKNADGAGPETRLTTPVAPSFGDLAGNWSPDGKVLFTRTFPGGDGEIFRINADGTNETNLTNRATQEVNPAVSPDGKKILFHSNRNFAPITPRDFDIYSMDPDGSNVTNITNDSGPNAVDLYPNWSPDGKEFVFERTSNDFAFSNIFKMKGDGTGTPTQLTFATRGLNRNPVWSPDGTRISFDSDKDFPPAGTDPGNREVYTMNTDGSDVRRVTNSPAASDRQCDWQTIPRPPVPPPAARPPVNPVPVPAAAKLETSLTLTAKPKRDRRLPFEYSFSGRVKLPAGVSAAAVCGGTVEVSLKRGGKRVASGTARVSTSCTFRHRTAIRTTQRTRKKPGRLEVTATFGGNAQLKGSTRSTTVRFF